MSRRRLASSLLRCCSQHQLHQHHQQQPSSTWQQLACWALLVQTTQNTHSSSSSSFAPTPTAWPAGRCSFATAATQQQTNSSSSSTTAAPPSSEQQPPQQKAPRRQQQDAAPQLSFEQLREEYQQQLSIRNSQGESKLLALIRQASSTEQVQAALDVVRWDKMVRARLRQNAHLSPYVTNALLKAGVRAELGAGFAVTLLQRADELGLQVSTLVCEAVLESCIKQQDYWAAAEAWVYTQVFLADPTRKEQQQKPQGGVGTGSTGSAAAAGVGSSSSSPNQPQQQQAKRQGQLAWASNDLLRTYARALAGWLQQGSLASEEHKQHVERQLKQLAEEVVSNRGARMPPMVTEVLSGGGGGGEKAAATSESQQDEEGKGAEETEEGVRGGSRERV